MGAPLDYQQNFTLSYQAPLNLIPIFDWLNADANYTASYNWVRGTELEDGTNLGNTITNNRNLTVNGTFNMEKLYNHIPFLKKANERFSKTQRYDRNAEAKKRQEAKKKQQADKEKAGGDGKDTENKKEQKALPKNKKSFEKEITLMPDTTITINHGKKSRRLIVTGKTKDGKTVELRYKKLDDNKIKITNKVDSALPLKLTVTAREPLDNKGWYKATQGVARLLMMLRTVNFSYRNQYSMALPGFMPNIGGMLGQQTGGDIMSPGLDFAFGLNGDSYIDKANSRNWLLVNDSIATPATTNLTSDLQLRATIEPVKDLKIDLNANRTETKARSIQYMYAGTPTTQSGTFTMTTWSLGSAFESIGSATDGYHSASFERFCQLAGSDYSSQSLIPAFIEAYTSMSGKGGAFPSITSLLPNWSLHYSGLGNLPWFRDHFRSININHSYKSIYSVGAYSSSAMPYDDWQAVSSLWSQVNIPTVSINESFSPLLGLDVTFFNNMTCKLEFRSTRTLSLSMTSVQINQSSSNDWVVGMGYKINDLKLFGWNAPKTRRVKATAKKKAGAENEKEGSTASSGSQKKNNNGFNNDLNLRLDLSLRSQAAITRDIATMTSAASSGNSAFKLSFSADYTMSRLLTMSFYFDRQTNTPLLSSNSYPTTTQDFGLSLKFSLTR
jgi:cell surface protein SprA